MLRPIGVGLLAWAFLVGPVTGAPWPVERGPNPYRYDPAVWKKVPTEFLDDAPACILYAASTHLVEADGTVKTITPHSRWTASRPRRSSPRSMVRQARAAERVLVCGPAQARDGIAQAGT
jgi:hypothetical protein